MLDENLDWRLKRSLPGHQVESVQNNGWAGTKNGKLLALAEASFDVFVTMDGNLSFQQNIPRLQIAIVTLHARSNRLKDTEPLMLALLTLLPDLKPGTVTVVG